MPVLWNGLLASREGSQIRQAEVSGESEMERFDLPPEEDVSFREEVDVVAAAPGVMSVHNVLIDPAGECPAVNLDTAQILAAIHEALGDL